MIIENGRRFLLTVSVVLQAQGGSNGQEKQTGNSSSSATSSSSSEKNKTVTKPVKVVPAQSNLGQTGGGVKWDPNKVMPEPYNDND